MHKKKDRKVVEEMKSQRNNDTLPTRINFVRIYSLKRTKLGFGHRSDYDKGEKRRTKHLFFVQSCFYLSKTH